MTIEELNTIDTINFVSIFGGTFFMQIFGDAMYETKNGCFILKDKITVEELIKESIKQNINLLEKQLQRFTFSGTI